MAPATREGAERLRALHHADAPLVLVNAWDAASARIAESLGFPAVGTSSSGVKVPVSADLEAGYGPTVDDAVATARGAIGAGAVGLNLEDATGDPAAPLFDVPFQAERIRAIRATAASLGIPLVINARTDAMRHVAGDVSGRFAAAVERARAYIEAGCDCIFVPFVSDAETIGRLVGAIPAPLNILAGAETPPVAQLAALGVRRISLGGACARDVSPRCHRGARPRHVRLRARTPEPRPARRTLEPHRRIIARAIRQGGLRA